MKSSAGCVGEGQQPVIWYAWPYREWGGVQIYLLTIAQAAVRKGFAVRALIPDGSASELRALLDSRRIPFATFHGLWDSAPAPTIARRVQRRWRISRAERAMVARLLELATKTRRETIFHVDLGPWSSAGALARLLKEHPVICTLHTALPKVGAMRTILWRARLTRLLRNPRFRLTAANGDARRSLDGLVPPELLDRVELSPVALDREQLEAVLAGLCGREKMEKRLGLPPAHFRVGVLAQFIERKGCFVLLEAISRLSAEGCDVQVLWCGPGALDQVMRDRIERAGVSPRFHYRSAIDFGGDTRAALGAIRSVSDLFVLPSLLEGLPIALLEAMALGMACLTTRINEIPNVVDHGRNGWLVPPANSEALALAIRRLQSDPQLRAALGVNASGVLTQFDMEMSTRPTFAAYAEVAR